MANEIHLYTFGSDPFQLPVGEITFFVHQGLPPTQVTPVTATNISAPRGLGGSYQNYIIAPSDGRDVHAILDSVDAEFIDLGVGLGETIDSDAERRVPRDENRQHLVGTQMQALLDGLGTYRGNHQVAIHVIQDE